MKYPQPIYYPIIPSGQGQGVEPQNPLNTETRQLGDHDEGQEKRHHQGLALAHLVKESRLGYAVPSQSGTGTYTVSGDNDRRCTCQISRSVGSRASIFTR